MNGYVCGRQSIGRTTQLPALWCFIEHRRLLPACPSIACLGIACAFDSHVDWMQIVGGEFERIVQGGALGTLGIVSFDVHRLCSGRTFDTIYQLVDRLRPQLQQFGGTVLDSQVLCLSELAPSLSISLSLCLTDDRVWYSSSSVACSAQTAWTVSIVPISSRCAVCCIVGHLDSM